MSTEHWSALLKRDLRGWKNVNAEILKWSRISMGL
jgi:hypothetical protein